MCGIHERTLVGLRDVARRAQTGLTAPAKATLRLDNLTGKENALVSCVTSSWGESLFVQRKPIGHRREEQRFFPLISESRLPQNETDCED